MVTPEHSLSNWKIVVENWCYLPEVSVEEAEIPEIFGQKLVKIQFSIDYKKSQNFL